MELIIDIIGEILEGIFEFGTKSSFKALKKKFKGEKSDDISDKDENEWDEVSEFNEINEWNEIDYDDKENNKQQINEKKQGFEENKINSLKTKSNLEALYNAIKLKTNDNIEQSEQKYSEDIVCDNKRSSRDDLCYNIQQNNNGNLCSDVKQNNEMNDYKLFNNKLDFNKEAVRNAIIYSEILGKPKAKSKRRRKNWI